MKIFLPIEFNETNWQQQLNLAVRLALTIGIPRDQFVTIATPFGSNYGEHLISRYDFLVEEKKRNVERNARIKAGLSHLCTKKSTRVYDRLATIPLGTVFSNMGKSIKVMDHSISIKSKRYKCYARKGVVCVRCGIAGAYFAAEKSVAQPTQRYHLNLYAVDANGKETMITVDHIIPLSRNGEDKVHNLQPMCIICNGEKGNRTEEELKNGVTQAEIQKKLLTSPDKSGKVVA